MYDMAVRLKVCGLNPDKFILQEDYEALTEKIKTSSSNKIYILATYTATVSYTHLDVYKRQVIYSFKNVKYTLHLVL